MDLLGVMYFITYKRLCYTLDLLLAFKVTKPRYEIMRFQPPTLALAETELPPPKQIKSKALHFPRRAWRLHLYPLEGAHGAPRSSPNSRR